jgi:hypothetical protein
VDGQSIYVRKCTNENYNCVALVGIVVDSVCFPLPLLFSLRNVASAQQDDPRNYQRWCLLRQLKPNFGRNNVEVRVFIMPTDGSMAMLSPPE